MAPSRISLASLTDRSRNFVVVVRLESLSASKKRLEGEKTLQNLLFSDNEGTEMAATIFEEDIAFYKDVFHEGHEYEIPNPTIKIIPEQFRTDNHMYQMYLRRGIQIVDLGPAEVQRTYWMPVNSVTDCLDRRERFAISVSSLRTITSRTTGENQDARDIVIVDQTMQPVVVTAWRGLALESIEKIARIIESLPLIQITRVKASGYGGGCWGTTRFSSIRLNSVAPAAEALRTWAINNKETLQQLRNDFRSNVIGETSARQAMSTEEVRLLLPIGSLVDQPEGKTIQIKGKIQSVLNPDSFAYTTCSICKEETTTALGEPFYCDAGEKRHNAISNPTCALEVVFADNTGETHITLYDSLAEVIIRKRTTELIALGPEERRSLIDETMNRIKDREFVIKMWSYVPSGPVKQVLFRPQHIKEADV